jgi:energy-coupling factor transporter ATP-binding protein EcfA2
MWFEHFTSSMLNRFFTRPPAGNQSGLMLGKSVDPPHQPVVLPDRHRNEHAVIIGKTGSGKTHLLEFLAVQLAKRGEGFSFFDFHGDASLSLMGRLRQLPHADERLIVVDPSHPTQSPGINVLESGASDAERFRKVSEISSILRQRWGVDSFGARTEELLRNSLYTLAGTGHTLVDLPKLLTDTGLRRRLTDQLEHPDIQAYWRDRYEPLSEAMKGAFREPLLNKVTAFLTEPAARHLLGQSESTVDVADVMRKQQWLIFRLPKGRLREHAHTLGNLLFAQLQFAALARESVPQRARRTFTLLCDEVQNLAENDLATLITEGRKFGISVITANQFWEQLPKELRGALLSAASHICFRVSSADANILAAELSLERRSRLTLDLTNLVRGEAVGRFGSQSVVRFRVPALPDITPVTDADLDAIVAPITRSRVEIERQLRHTPAPEASAPRPTRDARRVREGQDDW